MAEVIQLKPPTKNVTYEHGGQRYTCAFDPNAPPDKRWVWHIDYVRTYRYVGSAATMERAAIDARRKIHSLNKHVAEMEESV